MIIFNKKIGPVPIDCVVSEAHESSIGITAIPIETGAEVNDHAYIEAKRITLEICDGNAVATYAALIRFQESRVPFVLVTGLSVYRNMMIKLMSVTRDKTYSTVLNGRVDLQEVIIVDTSYAAAETGDDAPSRGVAGRKAARPSPSRASDAASAVRSSGTVQRGDTPSSHAPLLGGSPAAVQNRAIIQGVFR